MMNSLFYKVLYSSSEVLYSISSYYIPVLFKHRTPGVLIPGTHPHFFKIAFGIVAAKKIT